MSDAVVLLSPWPCPLSQPPGFAPKHCAQKPCAPIGRPYPPAGRWGHACRVSAFPLAWLLPWPFPVPFFSASYRAGAAHQRAPCEQHCRHQNNRENDLIETGPTVTRQQHAGRERADGHGAEYQEIIECLHFVALVRVMAFGDQGRGADEGEIPADPQHRKADPKIPKRDAEQVYDGGGGD